MSCTTIGKRPRPLSTTGVGPLHQAKAPRSLDASPNCAGEAPPSPSVTQPLGSTDGQTSKCNERLLEKSRSEDSAAVCANAAASLPTPSSTPTSYAVEDPEQPPTPSTSALPPLVTPRHINNIYAHAQRLLSTNAQLPVTGRHEQRATLIAFLASRFPAMFESSSLQTEASAISTPSLYVSGPPGIGKTALVSSVVHDFSLSCQGSSTDIRVHMENCSTLGALDMRTSVWDRLGRGLGMDMDLGRSKTKRTSRQAFESGLQSGPAFLLVLDEIDHIHTSRTADVTRDLLNSLFAMAHSHASSLTLIGIANALDLTTKSIRLSDPPGKGKEPEVARPQVLHFRAYAGPDIEAIISNRLRLLSDTYPIADDDTASPKAEGPLPLVAESALKLCALKIAARHGDVRSALEVVRRAVSAVEAAEFRKLAPSTSQPATPTKSSHASTSYFSRTVASGDPLSIHTRSTAPRVTMSIMSASLKAAGFGVPPAVASLLADLNLNARMALVAVCVAISRQSLAGFETKAFDRSVNIKELHLIYTQAVSDEGTLKAVNIAEFAGAIDMLEGAAFVRAASPLHSKTGTRAPRKSPIKKAASERPLALSAVPLDELVEALKTVPSSSCDQASGSLSAGAMQETLRISKAILDSEERRLGQERRRKEFEKRGGGRDTMAPREGFSGNGLDPAASWTSASSAAAPPAKQQSWIGKRRPAGISTDMSPGDEAEAVNANYDGEEQ